MTPDPLTSRSIWAHPSISRPQFSPTDCFESFWAAFSKTTLQIQHSSHSIYHEAHICLFFYQPFYSLKFFTLHSSNLSTPWAAQSLSTLAATKWIHLSHFLVRKFLKLVINLLHHGINNHQKLSCSGECFHTALLAEFKRGKIRGISSLDWNSLS